MLGAPPAFDLFVDRPPSAGVAPARRLPMPFCAWPANPCSAGHASLCTPHAAEASRDCLGCCRGDGTGGESIYGEKFADENFKWVLGREALAWRSVPAAHVVAPCARPRNGRFPFRFAPAKLVAPGVAGAQPAPATAPAHLLTAC